MICVIKFASDFEYEIWLCNWVTFSDVCNLVMNVILSSCFTLQGCLSGVIVIFWNTTSRF